MLLDATHHLFSWVMVQFSTMFCSSPRTEQAIEYTGSRGWAWQTHAGLDLARLSVVFLFLGFVEHSFLQGGMYNHTLSVYLSVSFLLALCLDLWKKKKKEWICSISIVLSKSFLFNCSYYSFSPSCCLFWDLCHSYSGRVLWATLHVYRMAHMIELEPLTCTIVVRGKSKVGRFKLD